MLSVHTPRATSRAIVDRALQQVRPGALLQDRDELEAFLDLVQGVQTILEIGMHAGGTAMVWCELARRVVGVDLPDGPGCGLDRAACDRRNAWLAQRYPGFVGILGDSRDPQVVEAVRRCAPFDLVFIDGAHDYATVRHDWQQYGPMASTWIALHDVNDATIAIGPHRLWAELTATHRTTTIGVRASVGIGVVHV